MAGVHRVLRRYKAYDLKKSVYRVTTSAAFTPGDDYAAISRADQALPQKQRGKRRAADLLLDRRRQGADRNGGRGDDRTWADDVLLLGVAKGRAEQPGWKR